MKKWVTSTLQCLTPIASLTKIAIKKMIVGIMKNELSKVSFIKNVLP